MKSPILWLLMQALLAQLIAQSVSFAHMFEHAFDDHGVAAAHPHYPDIHDWPANRYSAEPGEIQEPESDAHESSFAHILAHVAHCCHLVAISSVFILNEHATDAYLTFLRRDPGFSSLAGSGPYRPPIII
ncbi:MAG: hypothetical protein WD397_02605 [Wenzhouxiangellaceae bacterium]